MIIPESAIITLAPIDDLANVVTQLILCDSFSVVFGGVHWFEFYLNCIKEGS